ncbi:MutL C terminal dimerization domain-containing protein [Flammula alnicola]|nr:MutL C terminal dimerization domain-containing protein [Flammula alnicola]
MAARECGKGSPDSVLLDASVSNTENDQSAVDALARVIEKKDFATMGVVGQFNLGFIVVRRRKPRTTIQDTLEATSLETDDLFIVDQHAADEKYNFETLQATTRIQSQKLFRPRPIELTASDEMLAIENLEILQQNGFEVDVDEEGYVGQGSRLRLVAQPVSKSTVFDMKDLEEVINLMRDRPGGQMVRCSKARAMFAMRACRKSVMIGMPLTQHQMTTVIRHMGTMDQPWNCPHGRPTMRHLLDIRTSGSRPKEDIDWSSFQ